MAVGPQVRDVAGAGALTGFLVLGQLFVVWLVQTRQPVPPPLPPGSVVTVCLLTVAAGAAVAVRRRWPVVSLGAATSLVLVCAAVELSALGPGVALVVCAYTVATLRPWRHTVPILLTAAAAHAAGGILAGSVRGLPTFWGVPGQDIDAMITATVASYAIPGTVGFLVRRRRRQTVVLAAEAAARERGRIARELHDIAAHDLSAIVVQAGAADRLVDRDPEAAKEVLRAIRGQGRGTLEALRALVGIMRDDDAGGRSPQPGLDRLGDLFAVAEAAGMSLTTSITGDPPPLGHQTDLAAYRIVQEALTNARRHAPGAPVTVTVTCGDDVRLEIRNPLTGGEAGRGHGLAGMRERVRQPGGTLDAGPSGSEWVVVATLPAGGR